MAKVGTSVLVPLGIVALGALIAARVAMDRSGSAGASKTLRLAHLALTLTFLGLFIGSWLTVEVDERPAWWILWMFSPGMLFGAVNWASSRRQPNHGEPTDQGQNKPDRKGMLIYFGLLLGVMAIVLTVDAIRS